MLNKVVYAALTRLFRSVEIINEDEPADIRSSAIRMGQWSFDIAGSRGEQYRVNCPFCKDSNKHLYVSYISYTTPRQQGLVFKQAGLLANCFHGCLRNRENRQRFESMLNMAMSLDSTAELPVVDLSPDDAQSTEQFATSTHVDLDGFRSWIPDYKPITEDTPDEILSYLAQRRVSWQDVEWTHMGWGPVKSPRSGNYLNNGHDCVLFPIVCNGALRGFQARMLPQYVSKECPKYWIHPMCRKSSVVYNMDEARRLGVAVVCEGVFDVVSVGRPGVCLFGHTPSAYQKKLLATVPMGLIWIPDTDVSASLDPIAIARSHVAQWATSYELGAHVVVLPSKDAGEMSRQEVWEVIMKQVDRRMRDYLAVHVLPNL